MVRVVIYASITDPSTSLMSFVFHSSFAIFTSRRPPSAPPRASDVRRWIEFGA